MTRFLFTGDRQIGGRLTFAANRLGEQEAVGMRIVELARERGCDAILDGGDVFEGPIPAPEHFDAFIRPLETLHGEIPIIVTTGNGRHDSATRPTNALSPLRHVPGLTIHSTPGLEVVDGTYVACMPWVSVARPVALHNGDVAREDVNAEAAQYLLAIARDLRNHIPAGAASVLMLHFDIEGAGLPNGLPTDATHGVILPLADLEAIGFDVVLAAHIHRPQYVIRDGGWATPDDGGCFVTEPTALYAGSPMPHDFGEANTPHGVWIVDIEAGYVSAEFVPVESRSVVTFEYDDTDPDNPHVLEEILRGDFHGMELVPEAIVRFRYEVTEERARAVSQAAIRQALLDAGAHRVDVRCTVVRADRARVAGITDTLDDLQALDLYFDARQTPVGQREELRELAATYLQGAAA